MKKVFALFLAVLMACMLIAGCTAAPAAPAAPSGGASTAPTTPAPAPAPAPAAPSTPKYPTKSIELVCPYSAGGGSDLNARTIAEIITSNKLTNEAVMVANKPGGSGGVGNSYVYAKDGDAHTLVTVVSGQMMSALVNNAEVQIKDLTPIACLALDEYILGGKAGGSFENLEDFIAKAKANPGKYTIGGAGKGNEDQYCYELINKFCGTDIGYVSFDGSGDVMSAVLGGHIDAGIFNPNECLSQIKAGQAIPIAVYSPGALEGIDAPSFTEAGYPGITFQQFRSIAGPPNMPDYAIKFWEDALKKVSESDKWVSDYCAKNYLTPKYMDSKGLAAFWASEEEKYVAAWKEAGMIK